MAEIAGQKKTWVRTHTQKKKKHRIYNIIANMEKEWHTMKLG